MCTHNITTMNKPSSHAHEMRTAPQTTTAALDDNTTNKAPDDVYFISLRVPQSDPKNIGVPAEMGGKVAEEASYITRLRPNDDVDNKFTYNLQDSVGVDIWAERLKRRISETPNHNVIVLITGFNNHAPKAVTRHLAIRSGLEHAEWSAYADSLLSSAASASLAANATTSTTVVHFDWPARKNVNYTADRKTARQAAAVFRSTCLDVLRTKVGLLPQQIHVLTLSMGAFVLCKALFSYKAEAPMIGHLFLSQSDVAQRYFSKLHPRFSTHFVTWVQSGVTIYWSSKDVALRWSSLVRLRHRLGSRGIPRDTLEALNSGDETPFPIHNVSCTNYASSLPSEACSHEWPLFGESSSSFIVSSRRNSRRSWRNSPAATDEAIERKPLRGDLVLLEDVLQVLDGVTAPRKENSMYRHRESKNASDRNWRLKE